MRKKMVTIILVLVFLFCIFVCTKVGSAARGPLLPKNVRAVFNEYAKKYPQGRLDHASKIGDRFFLGIIVFPKEDKLDVRYLLVGKFKGWEPIAEFEKLPY